MRANSADLVAIRRERIKLRSLPAHLLYEHFVITYGEVILPFYLCVSYAQSLYVCVLCTNQCLILIYFHFKVCKYEYAYIHI